MPLTIQTIEELKKRLEANRMPVIDLETHETTQPSGRMLVDIEECEELLAAARWALEAGYGQESDDEIVESPDMCAAKVFMNGFEVTYAKDGESIAIDQPNSSSQDGRKG